MAIHVGWPDITQSRRKSLMRARERAQAMISATQELFLAYEAFIVKVSAPEISEKVKKLNEIIRLIDSQFPEVRNSEGFDWSQAYPATNAFFNRDISQIRRSLAGCFSLWPWELEHFLETHELHVDTLKRLKNINKRKRGTQ